MQGRGDVLAARGEIGAGRGRGRVRSPNGRGRGRGRLQGRGEFVPLRAIIDDSGESDEENQGQREDNEDALVDVAAEVLNLMGDDDEDTWTKI